MKSIKLLLTIIFLINILGNVSKADMLEVSTPDNIKIEIDEHQYGIKHYWLGDVPPQIFEYSNVNQKLNFVIEVPDGTAGSFQINNIGDIPGKVNIDANTGLFEYQPESNILKAFNVKIKHTSGQEQIIEVAPFNLQTPEYDSVSPKTNHVEVNYDKYITVTDTTKEGLVYHNNKEKTVHEYIISGVTVTLDASSDSNGLFKLLNNREDIFSVTIYAEKVVLHGNLTIPNSSFVVYADELIFDDADGTSLVDITPRSPLPKADISGDGVDGMPARHIALMINQLKASSPSTRFKLRGGTGGDPGYGKDGANGVNLPVAPHGEVEFGNSDCKFTKFPYSNAVYVALVTCRGTCYEWGSKQWPDGLNAVPPGKPGKGGNGGVIMSSIPLPKIYDVEGGVSGKKGASTKGGTAGSPLSSSWETHHSCMFDGKPSEHVEHIAKNGTAGVAREADIPKGANGQYQEQSVQKFTWLRPEILESVTALAKDLYMRGDLDAAGEILSRYQNALKDLNEIDFPGGYLPKIVKSKLQINELAFKLAGNVDYFGNKPSWTPLLSFQINKFAFENEVKNSIEMMYLAAWGNYRYLEKKKDKEAIEASIKKLKSDVALMINNYEAVRTQLPAVQKDLERVSRQEVVLLKAIKDRQDQLLLQAKDNTEKAFILQAAKVLSVACKVIPVYQPVLGAVGAGLDLITEAAQSPSLDDIGKIAGVASAFSASNIQKSEAQLNDMVDRLKRSNYNDNKTYINGLASVGKDFANSISEISSAINATKISNEDLQAEFEKLKKTDASYNQLIDDVNNLAQEKGRLASALTTGLLQVQQYINGVNTNTSLIDSMNNQLFKTESTTDNEAIRYLKEVERNAKDRLRTYQYYLSKAYEYRFLKSYPLDYDLTQTMEAVDNLVKQSPSSVLTESQFVLLKNVYLSSLREAVAKGFDDMQRLSPDRELIVPVSLKPEQIVELNKNSTCNVDLSTEIAAALGEENRRIADVTFKRITIKSNPSKDATVRLVAKRTGESVIISNQKVYRFDHATNNNIIPFTWGAIYNIDNNEINNETKSNEWLSLLASLLGVEEVKLYPYSEPSLEGNIKIEKIGSAEIRDLTLEIKTHFQRNNPEYAMLGVASKNNHFATVSITPSDLNQRSDGAGSIKRIYDINEVVSLKAPTRLYNLKFKSWFDDQGNSYSTEQIDIKMNRNKNLFVLYQ